MYLQNLMISNMRLFN